MFSVKELWNRVKKPMFGLSMVGVSTTMVACYGMPADAHYDAYKEYCEDLLIQACEARGNENPDGKVIEIPDDCPVHTQADIDAACAERLEKGGNP